jgi:putative membrane protein
MKHGKQFSPRTLLLATCACALAGCAALTSPDMRMGASPLRPAVAAAPFTSVERDFVTKVAVRAVYEIEVSKLAAERAVSPAVREYARRLAQDDTLMNDDLIALMSTHGVAPPKGLPADKATKLHRLASLPRSDAFDNGYIRVVGIEDRRKAIAMFEKARKDVRDRDLRAWIDRSLTIMRTHLANAQGVAASLAG